MAKPKKIDASKIKVTATKAKAWEAKQPMPEDGPYKAIVKNFEMVVFEGKNGGYPVWNFELHYDGGFMRYASLNIPSAQAEKKGRDIDAFTGLLKQFIVAFGYSPEKADKLIANNKDYGKLGTKLEGRPVMNYFLGADKLKDCQEHWLSKAEYKAALKGELVYKPLTRKGSGHGDTRGDEDGFDDTGGDNYYGDDSGDDSGDGGDGESTDDEPRDPPKKPTLPGGKKKNKNKK